MQDRYRQAPTPQRKIGIAHEHVGYGNKRRTRRRCDSLWRVHRRTQQGQQGSRIRLLCTLDLRIEKRIERACGCQPFPLSKPFNKNRSVRPRPLTPFAFQIAVSPLSFPSRLRERIAGLQNRSFAKMNQRPKLGSEGRGVNVRFWVSPAGLLRYRAAVRSLSGSRVARFLNGGAKPASCGLVRGVDRSIHV